MLVSLAYSLARCLAELCLVRRRSDAQLRAEVLALRHQHRVLERKLRKPCGQPTASCWSWRFQARFRACYERDLAPAACQHSRRDSSNRSLRLRRRLGRLLDRSCRVVLGVA
jgi:hypothetical protein